MRNDSELGIPCRAVFKFSGLLLDEGNLRESGTPDDHYAIVTYWRSFEDHEKSHADELFNKKFAP